MIHPIKHNDLDSTTFAEATRGKIADLREIEDLTGKVWHVGYGGAAKSSYTSPNDGRPVYVLEQSGLYAPDAYVNHIWQFREDFSISDANAFLCAIRDGLLAPNGQEGRNEKI